MAPVLGFLFILLPAFAVLADTPPQFRVALIDKFYPPIEELRGAQTGKTIGRFTVSPISTAMA